LALIGLAIVGGRNGQEVQIVRERGLAVDALLSQMRGSIPSESVDSDPVGVLAPDVALDTPTPDVPDLPTPGAPEVTTAAFAPGSIEAYICSLPWPCSEAICIARRESGTDAQGNLDGWFAHTPGYVVWGLFQLSDIHFYAWPDMFTVNDQGIPNWADPIWNTDHALILFQQAGGSFRDWDGSPSCWGGN
jgi:hypothetical protein